MRIPVPPAKPTFHTPMRFDRTAEKVQTLSQEQLLNLLDNLDYQLAIGRVPQDVASALEPRIVSPLTLRDGAKCRKQVAINIWRVTHHQIGRSGAVPGRRVRGGLQCFRTQYRVIWAVLPGLLIGVKKALPTSVN